MDENVNEDVKKSNVEGYCAVIDEVQNVELALEGKDFTDLPGSSANRNLPLRCQDQLLTVMAMGLATYVGVLTRIGLTLVPQSIGVEHFPSLYAQIVGTFIMGLLLSFKDSLIKKHSILYTTLSTGLCGCITTFSSWNAEAARVLLQLNETSLKFLNVEFTMARALGPGIVLLLGVGMSLSALRLGNNIGLSAQAIEASGRKPLRDIRRRLTVLPVRYCAPSLTVLTWIVATALSIYLCTHYGNFDIMFALLLGPAGTYIRWQLGGLDYKTRKRARGFPVGTFIANIAGSFVLAFTLVCEAYFIDSAGSISYSLLAGVAVGFCGCLTTVSTFVTQLSSLPFNMAAIYALTSISVAQVQFICILGGYAWIR